MRQSRAAVTENSRSWARAGLPQEVLDALSSGLPASEVWSLLLGVLEKRASGRTPASLRQQWREDRFVQPCAVDARVLQEVDRHLFSAAGAFEAVELSPLAPLGVCSSVALASQNKIVSTVRGMEVVSDPTNVLALECARRLQADAGAHVRLVTSHRCVRAQAIPKVPGFAAHFRMFCLASAGHELKDRAFLRDSLIEHIRTHLSALAVLGRNGFSFGDVRMRLLATEALAPIADRVAEAVGSAVPVQRLGLEHRYYDGIRFMIDVRAPSGADIPLIDGGAFDWLRRLSSNEKLTYVASAMGSQLVAFLFRAAGGGAG